MSGFDLPFEGQDRVEVDVAGHMVAGVYVLAAKIPSPLGEVPALIFRFPLPGGPASGFLADVIMPLDGAAQGDQLAELVRAAVAQATR